MKEFAWSGLKHGINCTLNSIFLFVIFILGAKFSIDGLEVPAEDVIISTVLLYTVFKVIGFKLDAMPSYEEAEAQAEKIFSICDNTKEEN